MQAGARSGSLRLGRYVLLDAIASGGMATVHFGRLQSVGGFRRTVAIKRLHPHLAADPAFVRMFLDEARLAARVQHPNVVQTFDAIYEDGELFVVMDYVHGEPLGRLLREAVAAGLLPPLPVGVAIVCGALHGLHAAHEARSDRGEPLAIVHRDVSPQNVIVGADGIVRVLDFGVAKAKDRLQATESGVVKGKLGYMAPEQLRGGAVDRRADIYAAGVVLWEALTGERLVVCEGVAEPPSGRVPTIPPAIDAIVLRALQADPARRFDDARQMAGCLEAAVTVASPSQVAEWTEAVAGPALRRRAEVLATIELEENAVTRERETVPEAIAPGARGPRSARSRRVLVAGAGLALLVTLAVVARALAPSPPSPAARTAAPPVPPTRPVDPAPAEEARPDTPGPPEATPALAPPPATPLRRPPPSRVATAVATKLAPAPSTAPAAPSVAPVAPPPPSAPRVACTPPYRLGPNGEKLWIPECL